MFKGDKHETEPKENPHVPVMLNRPVLGGGGGNAGVCFDPYAACDSDVQQSIQVGWGDYQ